MPQSPGTQVYDGGSCQRGRRLKLQDQVRRWGVSCFSFSQFNVKRALEGGGEEFLLVISFSRVSSHILEMGGNIFLRSVTSMGGLGAPRMGNSVVP